MTVKELKEALKNVPDDTQVLAFEEYLYREVQEVKQVPITDTDSIYPCGIEPSCDIVGNTVLLIN